MNNEHDNPSTRCQIINWLYEDWVRVFVHLFIILALRSENLAWNWKSLSKLWPCYSIGLKKLTLKSHFPIPSSTLKSQYYTVIWFLQFICKENIVCFATMPKPPCKKRRRNCLLSYYSKILQLLLNPSAYLHCVFILISSGRPPIESLSTSCYIHIRHQGAFKVHCFHWKKKGNVTFVTSLKKVLLLDHDWVNWGNSSGRKMTQGLILSRFLNFYFWIRYLFFMSKHSKYIF